MTSPPTQTALLAHLESLGVATYALDLADGSVWWSDGVYRLLGVEPGEITPDPALWMAQIVDEDRAEAEARSRSGLDSAMEFRIRQRNGQIRWVRGCAERHGGVVIGSLTDITDRRAQDAQAARSWRVHAMAQAVAQLGTWSWFPQHDLIEWSPELFRIFGLPEDFVPSVGAFDAFVLPEDRARLQESRARAQETGITESLELRIARPDGVRWIALRGESIEDESGRWYLGSVQDITERKELEAQASRLEKLDAVSRLASGVASGFERILDVAGAQIEALRGHATLAGDALARAVSDGRDLARRLRALAPPVTEAGSVDLVDAARGAASLVSNLAGPAVEVAVEAPAEAVWAHGDPAEVSQMLVSLMLNAREASPEGGRVAVRVLSGARPVVHVVDHGVGMDRDTLARAFDPYFSTKGSGRGLGLAVVAGLAQKARAKVDLQSTIGQGTAAAVWFEPAPAPGAEDGPVLLLIDDPVAREVLRMVLAAAGRSVRSTLDGPPPSRVLADNPALVASAVRRWDVPVLWCGVAPPAGSRGRSLPLPVRPDDLLAALRERG